MKNFGYLFFIQQTSENKNYSFITIIIHSPRMICTLYDYLQNFNNFEKKVAELQNFKFGQNL